MKTKIKRKTLIFTAILSLFILTNAELTNQTSFATTVKTKKVIKTKKKSLKKSKKKVKKKTKKKTQKKKSNTKTKTKKIKKPKINTTDKTRSDYVDMGDYFKKVDRNHLNIKAKVKYILTGLLDRVVQKQVNHHNQMYALQVSYHDSYIFKTPITGRYLTFPDQEQAMHIPGTFHSQLLEPAGGNYWLVGVTPKITSEHPTYWTWSTEIARTTFTSGEIEQESLPRLTHLEKASSDKNYTPDQLERVEATVSPNLRYLLILSLQYPEPGQRVRNIHMAIYSMDQINRLFDQAQNSSDHTVSLDEISPIKACKLKGVYGNQIKEIQGLALDNNQRVYIASEKITTRYGLKSRSSYPREIIKMKFGQTNPEKWLYAKVNAPEWRQKTTEFEGMQIVNNKLELNVAYQEQDAPYADKENTIYEISGLVK